MQRSFSDATSGPGQPGTAAPGGGPDTAAPGGGEGPPVIVVGSGKGGVGKSVVAALMARGLAGRGRRVLLVEGNQNLGHLQVMFGIPMRGRLEEFARGGAAPEALVHQVADRLWLVPGDSGSEGLYGFGALASARLHHRLCALYDGFDAVVVDAGPGIEGVVRAAAMRGSRLVVVTVPEAPALTDAYALVKLVHLQLPALPIDLLVNRAESAAEGEATHARLASAVERFLGRSLGFLGTLGEVPALRVALRRPGGLVAAPGLGAFREAVAALQLPEVAVLAGATGEAVG
jgi:flagellar biosynthesis protein FlhG